MTICKFLVQQASLCQIWKQKRGLQECKTKVKLKINCKYCKLIVFHWFLYMCDFQNIMFMSNYFHWNEVNLSWKSLNYSSIYFNLVKINLFYCIDLGIELLYTIKGNFKSKTVRKRLTQGAIGLPLWLVKCNLGW